MWLLSRVQWLSGREKVKNCQLTILYYFFQALIKKTRKIVRLGSMSYENFTSDPAQMDIRISSAANAIGCNELYAFSVTLSLSSGWVETERVRGREIRGFFVALSTLSLHSDGGYPPTIKRLHWKEKRGLFNSLFLSLILCVCVCVANALTPPSSHLLF